MSVQSRLKSLAGKAKSTLGTFALAIRDPHRRRRLPGKVNSAVYWDRVYRQGGTSGSGSYGRLAEFKSEIINNFVMRNGIESVIEFGCGDGAQLAMMHYPRYLGIDTSQAALDLCRKRFAGDATKTFQSISPTGEVEIPSAELAVSLDVIYHLFEDEIFRCHMHRLFSSATRYVIIYSSNNEEVTEWRDVRNRIFTDWINENCDSWHLVEHIPNRYPPNGNPRESSFADFYMFELDIPRP